MPINLFDSYHLAAIADEIVPATTFFKDRYFPTGAGDIFSQNKVLTEYRKGDRKLAAVVTPRTGDIPIERRGYSLMEYEPVMVAPSRLLTVDELERRGFGEALYADTDTAVRAARLILEDMQDMERRIARREEQMCSMLMQENSMILTPMIDEDTKDEEVTIAFYDQEEGSDHEFIVQTPWNAAGGNHFGDVRAMCRLLASRGLTAADLVLGVDAADAILEDEVMLKRLNTTSGIDIGTIEQELSAYDGVAFMGRLNYSGFKLNLISVEETYEADDGTTKHYFPTDAAMVTAPGCGHTMYGSIMQIDYGDSIQTKHTGVRIPKLTVDQAKDTRKMSLRSRPLPAPRNYCPYIIAKNVVQ